MNKFEISINLDDKCKRCGQGGATQSGLCLKCIAKGVRNGEFDHILKRHKPEIKRYGDRNHAV